MAGYHVKLGSCFTVNGLSVYSESRNYGPGRPALVGEVAFDPKNCYLLKGDITPNFLDYIKRGNSGRHTADLGVFRLFCRTGIHKFMGPRCNK